MLKTKAGPVATEEELRNRIEHRMLTLETSSCWEGSDYVCKVTGVTRGGASINVQAASWEAAYQALPDWLRPE